MIFENTLRKRYYGKVGAALYILVTFSSHLQKLRIRSKPLTLKVELWIFFTHEKPQNNFFHVKNHKVFLNFDNVFRKVNLQSTRYLYMIWSNPNVQNNTT